VPEEPDGLRVYGAKRSSPVIAGAWLIFAAAAAVAVILALQWRQNRRTQEDLAAQVAELRAHVERMRGDMDALRSRMAGLQRTGERLSKLLALSNGGFEEGTGDRPLLWIAEVFQEAGGAVALDSAVRHGGERSLRYMAVPGRANHIRHCQFVPVEPGCRYLLKGWVKTSDVTPAYRRHDGGAHLRVNTGTETLFSRALFGTSDWQEVRLEFNSGEARAVHVFLELGFHGNLATGTAWFDDAAVEILRHPDDKAQTF
jgi:outer membrane murein-binding lipoprotein Lpp